MQGSKPGIRPHYGTKFVSLYANRGIIYLSGKLQHLVRNYDHALVFVFPHTMYIIPEDMAITSATSHMRAVPLSRMGNNKVICDVHVMKQLVDYGVCPADEYRIITAVEEGEGVRVSY